MGDERSPFSVEKKLYPPQNKDADGYVVKMNIIKATTTIILYLFTSQVPVSING